MRSPLVRVVNLLTLNHPRRDGVFGRTLFVFLNSMRSQTRMRTVFPKLTCRVACFCALCLSAAGVSADDRGRVDGAIWQYEMSRVANKEDNRTGKFRIDGTDVFQPREMPPQPPRGMIVCSSRNRGQVTLVVRPLCILRSMTCTNCSSFSRYA
jgi:hypothetical protein